MIGNLLNCNGGKIVKPRLAFNLSYRELMQSKDERNVGGVKKELFS
jgi:hypothetical protein